MTRHLQDDPDHCPQNDTSGLAQANPSADITLSEMKRTDPQRRLPSEIWDEILYWAALSHAPHYSTARVCIMAVCKSWRRTILCYRPAWEVLDVGGMD